MKWLLMWLNVSVATLNATLQLLVIYRLVEKKYKIKTLKGWVERYDRVRSLQLLRSRLSQIMQSSRQVFTMKRFPRR